MREHNRYMTPAQLAEGLRGIIAERNEAIDALPPLREELKKLRADLEAANSANTALTSQRDELGRILADALKRLKHAEELLAIERRAASDQRVSHLRDLHSISAITGNSDIGAGSSESLIKHIDGLFSGLRSATGISTKAGKEFVSDVAALVGRLSKASQANIDAISKLRHALGWHTTNEEDEPEQIVDVACDFIDGALTDGSPIHRLKQALRWVSDSINPDTKEVSMIVDQACRAIEEWRETRECNDARGRNGGGGGGGVNATTIGWGIPQSKWLKSDEFRDAVLETINASQAKVVDVLSEGVCSLVGAEVEARMESSFGLEELIKRTKALTDEMRGYMVKFGIVKDDESGIESAAPSEAVSAPRVGDRVMLANNEPHEIVLIHKESPRYLVKSLQNEALMTFWVDSFTTPSDVVPK